MSDSAQKSPGHSQLAFPSGEEQRPEEPTGDLGEEGLLSLPDKIGTEEQDISLRAEDV